MIRILIADDHPIFRQGLKQVLSEAEDIKVAGEAESGHQALELIRKHSYDIVSLDISMPDMSGLEILKTIKVEHPALPVLMLSIYPEEQFAFRALKAGAGGYLTKNSVPDELITAVRKIAGGSTYVTASLADRLAQGLQEKTSIKLPHEILSDREFEVLRLIGGGRSVSDIAGLLSLSIKTVSTHRAHILEKMRMDNTAQLIKYAVEHELTA